MEKEFWLERWERREIGFHQDEINPYLAQYWPELNLSGATEVFVPLCGKSRDMLWLREQEHRVLGVELSDIAVGEFFKENSYSPKQELHDRFDIFEANGIRMFCGDFFDLSGHELDKVTAVYDRASMVALPVEMRERYVRHLVNIMPASTRVLLITFDYPQAEMTGPPFSVSPGEVDALYRNSAEIRLLGSFDVLEQNPRFKQRGISRLQENIFLLTLK